jgi:hypothetical protein
MHPHPLEQRLPHRYLTLIGDIVEAGEHPVGHARSILKTTGGRAPAQPSGPSLFEPRRPLNEIKRLYVQAPWTVWDIAALFEPRRPLNEIKRLYVQAPWTVWDIAELID